LMGIALALVGTAHADTVVKTRNRHQVALKVRACPAQRAAGDTRNVHDFHVRIDGGHIIGGCSKPVGWSVNLGEQETSWKTGTRPIKFTAAGTNSKDFCIKVMGGKNLHWWTTAKDGSTIAQGDIPLP